MSILVCGGAGYIGSHCVRMLSKHGYECIIYDNLSEGHMEAVEEYTLIQGDLRDKKKLSEVFENYNIDGVIHFAAYALVGVSMEQPLEYYNNNVYATMCLLEEMKEHGVDKIVFSSTCATYGEPSYLPIDENMPSNPCNPYGQTKKDIENMLKWCEEAYGIHYVALRYFNAAGAMLDGSIGEDHKLETHLIPIVLQQVSGQREKIYVYGADYPTNDGSCIRDYVHVLDLADAHIKAFSYLEQGGESGSFNLGTGIPVSVIDIINCVENVTGRRVKYEVTERRKGDPAQLIASYEKAENILGWIPHYSKTDIIIKSAWEWHRKHPHGFSGER